MLLIKIICNLEIPQTKSEDEDQSDGISIISESDRDECRDVNSQYFWDNTHISLSNENSEREQDHDQDVPDDKECSKGKEPTNLVTKEEKKRSFLKPFLLINLILISNIITYRILESQHAAMVEKYQLAEAQNQDLRLEINTLRKIVFLMNLDEQHGSTSTGGVFEEPSSTSEDVRIFDRNERKFICVDVKRFVDML